MQNCLRFFIISTLVMLGMMSTALASPGTFVYQGQITKNDGSALSGNPTIFQVQILSPTNDCVLYEETHTLNMSSSQGVFSLAVGNGVRSGVGFEDTSSLLNVFNNSIGNMTSLSCAAGNSYNPGATDRRKLRLTYNDGTGAVTVASDHQIQSVPYSWQAYTLQGMMPSQFLQVNGLLNVTQANLENLFTGSNYANLLSLAQGTSTNYVTQGSNGADMPTYASDPGSPVAGSVWFNTTSGEMKYYDGSSVQTIGAGGGSGTVTSVATGAGLTGGPVTTTGTISIATGGVATAMLADGSVTDQKLATGIDASKITTGTLPAGVVPTNTDTTKLPLAGGTMTGNITMGGNQVLNAGHLTQVAQSTITVGKYTNAQEATLTASLNGSNAGATWYNSDTGKLMWWSGSAPAREVADVASSVASVYGRTGAVVATAGDYTAAQITNTAAGNISAITAQAAINELDTEKVAKSGDTMTGALTVESQVNLNAQNELRFQDADSSNYVSLRAPAAVGSNITWTLPSTDGASGEILSTNGAGILSWISAAIGDITGVTAGSGLTGGGTNGDVTVSIATGGVTSTHINDGTITSTDINDGTIATADIADNAITSNKIADNQITTAKIVDSQVTNSKINSMSITKLTTGPAEYFAYMPAGTECATNEVLKWDAVTDRWQCGTDATGVSDHGALTGLADDDHTQYVMLAGRAGGQTIYGGTASGNDLTIESTSHATKGDLILQSNGGSVGIGTATLESSAALEVSSTTKGFLPPKMTTAQRNGIASPAEGLVVFDTTLSSLYVYKIGAWSKVSDISEVSFRVFKTATQSLNGGSVTALDWHSESWDVGSSFDLTTDRFQPTVPGKYFIYLQTYLNGLTVGSYNQPGIFKNGAIVNWGLIYTPNTEVITNVSAVVDLNGSTDYIDFRAVSGTSSTVLTSNTFATGYLISGGTGGAGGSADHLGNHTATQNITLGANWLSGDGGNEGLNVDSSGRVGVGATPLVALDVSSMTDAVRLPNGTTAQRPTAAAGQIRYNTTTNKFEGYENGAWVNLRDASGGVASSVSADTGTAATPSVAFTGEADTGFYNSNPNAIGVSAGGAQIFELNANGLQSPTTGGAYVMTYNGTASAPTYSFTGDTDTGWYRAAADTLAAATGGFERVRIDSSGNVGIGMTPTAAKLEVNGIGLFVNQLRVGGAATWGEGLSVKGNSVASGEHTLVGGLASDGNGNIYLGYDANGVMHTKSFVRSFNSLPLTLGTNTNLDVMTLLNSGNVGIGTTNPLTKLQVEGSAVASGDATVKNQELLKLRLPNVAEHNQVASFWLGRWEENLNNARTALTLSLKHANSSDGTTDADVMTLLSSGNVGIGTTNPVARLHLNPTITGATPASSGTIPSTGIISRFGNPNGGTLDFGMLTNGNTWLQSTNTADQSLYYNILLNPNGGNVGIGTTSPDSMLHVAGTAGNQIANFRNTQSSNGNIGYIAVGPSNGSGAIIGQSGHATTTSQYTFIGNLGDDVAGQGLRIYRGSQNVVVGGNVGIGTTDPGEKLVVGSHAISMHDGGTKAIAFNSDYDGVSGWDVASGGTYQGALQFDPSNGSFFIGSSNVNDSNFATSSNKVTILSSGNVGIGTTNPSYGLDARSVSSAMGSIFSAYQSVATVAPTNTWTKIAFNTDEYDSDNFFNTATNRFLPTKSGYYRITLTVAISQTGVGAHTNAISIYKNGSAVKSLSRLINYSGSFNDSIVLSTIIYMNGTTDYLEGYFTTNCSNSATAIQGSANTNFSGEFIRSQ